MTNQKALLQQLIDELRQAVNDGLLPADTLHIAGGVTDSVVVSGDNNTISIIQNEFNAKIDEQKLFIEALDNYREGQSREAQKIPIQPYPGLHAYDLAFAQRFFGREQAVTALAAATYQSKVIWLHGRSGVGKSSLLKAGLTPTLLRKGAFCVVVRPFDEYPTTALKKELLRQCWSPDLDLGKDSLLQFIHRLAKQMPGASLFIIFDQFEEFFEKQPPVGRESFARELADCLADPGLPTHFIFSLRSDLFGDTMPLRERIQTSQSREFYLCPLTTDEARQVIQKPLEAHGIACQESLVEAILTDLGSTEFNSPQLQLVCEKLFLSLASGENQITLEQYESLGRARNILGEYLRQAFRDPQMIPADHAWAARYLLSTLVTPEGRRDARRFSEWASDDRLQSMALAFFAKQNGLPMPNGIADPSSLRIMAVADYTRQVEPHTSLKGESLRLLVDEFSQAVVNLYVYQIQKSFVTDLVNALIRLRLLQEIQTEGGDLAYELVHDYLVAEIQNWLEDDELEARRVKRLLSQKQLDFERYCFLLTTQELALVARQAENPKLNLGEADLRLLLLSAAAYGNGQPWLTLSGGKGAEWLREMCQDNRFPHTVQLGAAGCLGRLDDRVAFDNLYKESVAATDRNAKSFLLDLMASYRHHNPHPVRLPWKLSATLFPRLARLRIADGATERSRISRVAVFTAPLCTVLIMSTTFLQQGKNAYLDFLFGTILLSTLASLAAYGFAEATTSLAVIMQNWNLVWQASVLCAAGSLIGVVLFYPLSGELAAWFSGGIIGLALAIFRQRQIRKLRWFPLLAGVSTGLIVMLFALVALSGIKGDKTIELFGSVLSTGLFAGIFLYTANRSS